MGSLTLILRIVVADVLSEFLEVAIHMILFVRGIYPPELFESTQKYSCPIKTARHPGLISYIQQIVQSIRSELLKDTIHRICVVTLNPEGKALDRFVFEMSMLRPFDDNILSNLDQFRNDSGTTNGRIDKGKHKAIEELSKNHSIYGAESSGSDHETRYGYDGDDEPLQRTTARERLQRQSNHQQFHPQHDHLHSGFSAPNKRDGPRFGAMMTLTTDVETMFRAMLLKISICDSYLKPPPQGNKVDYGPMKRSEEMTHMMLTFLALPTEDCSFTVVIEMKAPGNGPDAKV
ncbi:MAD2 mitotic arrest deficient-like 2 [Mortierella sp. AD011]|nr:MAD2 mitotic arrest deficient-like 2 [Mortierella sp. AD010]KAF9381938.1 MAD2 mitotic arrest deficient-like 2 [Mortierella sp. AD011]